MPAHRLGGHIREGQEDLEYLIEIKSDVFDIADRLKSIDGRYRLYYNTIAHRYEVYTLEPRPTLQVVLPFSPPDARCLEHVRKTRAERAAQLFEQYKKENERLQRAKLKECAERALSAAAGALSGRKNDA